MNNLVCRFYKRFYKKIFELKFSKENFFLFPFLPRKQIEIIKLQKLKKILRIAVETVPYYKNLKLKVNFDKFSLDELKKFPIIDKNIIKENIYDFISIKFKNRYFLSHTSGSTGEPFEFTLPFESDFIESMTAYRAWALGKEYQYKIGDPIIVLRSYSPKENEPLYKIDTKNNYWYLSPFNINKDNLNLYLDIIYKSKAKILRGYPSSIYIFTLLLKEKKIKISQIKTIITSSETLLPFYRETIEEYWGVKVLDWYGQNERTVTVQQCWAGNYHNNDDYGIVELNENNEIIATSLNNYVMPFIRYNTKDKAIPLKKPMVECKCGVNFSIPFKGIEGRSDDMLIKDDGTFVPSINIYTLMHELDFIKQFQIIQNSIDKSIVLKMVVEEFDLEKKARLIKEFKKRLGNITLSIEIVDRIERDKKTGKIKTIMRIGDNNVCE